MNFTSHIVARLGLDKSGFESGIRNVKNELRDLKGLKGLAGAGGVMMGLNILVNGFQSIAEAGADAADKVGSAWRDRLRGMATEVGSLKSDLSLLASKLIYIATLPVRVPHRFFGAMSGGANLIEAARIALDTGAEERRQREAAARTELDASARRLAMERATNEQKKAIILGEIDLLTAQREAEQDPAKKMEIQAKINDKLVEAYKVQETMAAAVKKSEEETLALEKQRADKLAELVQKQQDYDASMVRGIMNRAEAEKKLATAREDRRKFTVEDLASGPAYNRFSASNRYASQRIQWLEMMSRELTRAGRIKGPFGAEDAQSAADKLRSSLDPLKSGERNPYMDMQKSIEESKDQLKELNRKAAQEGLAIKPITGQ